MRKVQVPPRSLSAAVPQSVHNARALGAAFTLAAVSGPASAHGEVAVLSVGLQVLSFAACLVAAGSAKFFDGSRLAAVLGALFGLLFGYWPLGALPYEGNELYLATAFVLAPPLFMVAAAMVASLRRRPS